MLICRVIMVRYRSPKGKFQTLSTWVSTPNNVHDLMDVICWRLAIRLPKFLSLLACLEAETPGCCRQAASTDDLGNLHLFPGSAAGAKPLNCKIEDWRFPEKLLQSRSQVWLYIFNPGLDPRSFSENLQSSIFNPGLDPRSFSGNLQSSIFNPGLDPRSFFWESSIFNPGLEHGNVCN